MAASSSSMAAATVSPAASHIGSSLGVGSGSGGGSGSGAGGGGSLSGINPNAAQFREIHKNTWLKRLTAEGKRITVGPKKSDRSWVVFCVHDDTEALLEGYAEPRQAAAHNPEWAVSMQDTLHISHALIPNSHEFEFVVTLTNEVIRFHAMSWEIMQEWVETLRSKLREMKILSPRENLYTKLPEIRAPLLPTRDPTSPLPAPPPVPAALVPGVERVIPLSLQPENTISTSIESSETVTRTSNSATSTVAPANATPAANHVNRANTNNLSAATSTSAASVTATPSVSTTTTPAVSVPALSAMSNTLTQNLLNMLSDPISAYSEQLNVVDDFDEARFSDDANSESELTCFASPSSPLLRKSCKQREAAAAVENSIRVDVGVGNRISADQIRNWESSSQSDVFAHTRFQTSRSLSAGAADKTRKQINRFSTEESSQATSSSENMTALEINIYSESPVHNNTALNGNLFEEETYMDADKTNITIIQVSNESKQPSEQRHNITTKSVTGEIFKFPDTQNEYKSNVQIIPSNETNSSTIQLLGNNSAIQYSTPVTKSHEVITAENTVDTIPSMEQLKITTVHVAGDIVASTSSMHETQTVVTNGGSVYGTCYTTPQLPPTAGGTPKLSKKIILSANTSGVTNITVNNTKETTKLTTASCDSEVKHNIGNVHYEKVFLSTSVPVVTSITRATTAPAPVTTVSSPRCQVEITPSLTLTSQMISTGTSCSNPSTTAQTSDNLKRQEKSILSMPSSSALATTSTCSPTRNVMPSLPPKSRNKSTQSHPTSRVHPIVGSPAPERRRIASPTNLPSTRRGILPSRAHLLTRGLTEAVITTRPSRRDVHFLQVASDKGKSSHGVAANAIGASSKSTTVSSSNNNTEAAPSCSGGNVPVPLPNRISNESIEQRRRSSSTSDARGANRGANNNEPPMPGNRGGGISGSTAALRFQQPPQPFRNVENGLANGAGGSSHLSTPPPTGANSPAGKRMTLREHQVMQLRREIMHPGGVRLQLRRKDCVGSIAWVEAFGAIWVAGWKQKEHPVLYNALHIGDQLLSIGGISISSNSEANKIMRNSNTVFVELLVRRIPFGRGYAIRREREGQCLGLIRDGNTATIVDVVPNSLAARHGLPPKAQSCDGTTLTFWVLTEINGRPLNLFFKDNEIRDRLNSVGRDISILVQPSDLITKLKKQLKSLRGYKDYLVQ